MLTAVIPVKSYSERLKGKNLKPFGNTTLYEHKLTQLLYVRFDKVIISSENIDILDIATSYGYDIHLRKAEYSMPNIPMAKVYSYIASEVEGDDIAWINVTNPLVSVDNYKEAIIKYRDRKDHDCLLSVYNLQKYIWWQNKPINWQPYSNEPHPKSQDLVGLYAMSFAINILKRNDLIRWGTCVGHKPYFYIMDEITSTKIDYQWQFDLCEAEWKRKK